MRSREISLQLRSKVTGLEVPTANIEALKEAFHFGSPNPIYLGLVVV